jgi:hypothetical protein
MPSTTFNILAASLPALQGPGAARIIGDLATDPDTIYGADTVELGDTDILPRKLNQNALGLDYASKVGALGYGIVEGLTFSGSALSITVAAGKATIDGLIELHEDTVVVITNTTNYIWLKRDGTLEVKTTNAAPAIPACFLGIVIAAAGAVVNYDLSGVMYHVNGLLRRKTGDASKPTDTPGVTWCFLQISTNGRTYFWNGTEYQLVGFDRVAIVPLAAVDTGGGLFSWQNPEGVAIAITGIEIDVQTPSSGACTGDFGTATASGTTSSDNLVDGLDLSVAGLYNNVEEKGANGKSKQRLASGKWVTGSKATGASSGLVGFAYIHYFTLS